MAGSVFLGFVEVLREYGWTGICAITCIMWWFFGRKTDKMTLNNNHRFDKLTSQIANINDRQNARFTEFTDKQNERFDRFVQSQTTNQNELSNKIVDLLAERLDKSNKELEEQHAAKMKHKMSITQKVNNIMRDITQIYNADTTIICEFHNGSSSLGGIPFVSFDINYQWRSHNSNISPITNMKNIPYSYISGLVNSTTENNIYYCDDIESIIDVSPMVEQIFTEHNVGSFVCSCIYNETHNINGLIFMLYADKIPTHIDEDDIIHKTQQIEVMLSLTGNEN